MIALILAGICSKNSTTFSGEKMARRIKNVKLDTRTARRDLRQDKNPYWTRIDRNSHLGYRKGAKGGYWIVRIRLEDGFRMQSIGTADDTSDADSLEILDYFQA